jgi:hypothetical protein
VSFKDDYQLEKARKRMERDAKQFQRRMCSPVARGEVFQLGEVQMQHLASLALAVEALEDILIGKGVLEPDELMDTMRLMAEAKREVAAAAAQAGPNTV